jgi:hypothetical protein
MQRYSQNHRSSDEKCRQKNQLPKLPSLRSISSLTNPNRSTTFSKNNCWTSLISPSDRPTTSSAQPMRRAASAGSRPATGPCSSTRSWTIAGRAYPARISGTRSGNRQTHRRSRDIFTLRQKLKRNSGKSRRRNIPAARKKGNPKAWRETLPPTNR